MGSRPKRARAAARRATAQTLTVALTLLLFAGPAAADGGCPAAPATMRRIHPELLRHDRDLAVRQGRHQPGHALGDCVTCHARRDAAGRIMTANDPGHFCVACHRRAAVAPDCFSCHRSTPATETTP